MKPINTHISNGVVKYMEKMPEKVECDCDEIDGAGDFEDKHYRCEKRIKAYESSLQAAIESAPSFENQEEIWNLLKENKHSFTSKTEPSHYQISIDREVQVVNQYRLPDFMDDEWTDCKTEKASDNYPGAEYRTVARLVEKKEKALTPTNKYRHCNHHHELTNKHEEVFIGGEKFIANKEAIPLLMALSEIGLKTRTHHVDENGGFISILMDNVSIEVKTVFEADADRTKYNGKQELIISWKYE